MTHKNAQIITDFKVGDIVRVTSDHHWTEVARRSGLGAPGTKHRVIEVLPTEHNPGRTGDLRLEGVESGLVSSHRGTVGHLLVDPPREEDQPGFDASQELDLLRMERDAAKQALQALDRNATETIRRLKADLEQQEASTALEANRANKAEAAVRHANVVLSYIEGHLLPDYERGLLNGYRDRLAQEG